MEKETENKQNWTQEQRDFEAKWHQKFVEYKEGPWDIEPHVYLVTAALLNWESNGDTVFSILNITHNPPFKVFKLSEDQIHLLDAFEILNDEDLPKAMLEIKNNWQTYLENATKGFKPAGFFSGDIFQMEKEDFSDNLVVLEKENQIVYMTSYKEKDDETWGKALSKMATDLDCNNETLEIEFPANILEKDEFFKTFQALAHQKDELKVFENGRTMVMMRMFQKNEDGSFNPVTLGEGSPGFNVIKMMGIKK